MGSKGQAMVFEGRDLLKLDPCYGKNALAVEQDDFGFVGIDFKVVGEIKRVECI